MPQEPLSQSNLSRWQRWVLASRPKTLTAAATPVLVGCAIAYSHGQFQLPEALAALLVAFSIQIGTNLHNDVSDYQRGTDREDRLGPLRVTQAGLLTPEEVRLGAFLCFGLASLAGLFLVLQAGIVVLGMGVASILAALSYSAGPSPLSENGLADVFVLLFFGFVAVCGTVYVQMQRIPTETWLASAAVGGTITALLVVNNVRDIESDRLSGRRTIPVVYGRRVGILEYQVLLAVAYAVPVLMFVWKFSNAWVLIPLLTLPLAVRWSWFLLQHKGRILNRCLGGTAQLIFLHGYAMALGIVLGAGFPL